MVKIKPFKALIFNQEKAGDISNLIAPPYDVIDENDQEFYYSKSPFNIVRIIKGKENPDDSEFYNKYTRAKDYLDKWLKNKILIEDKKPSIYVYHQYYSLDKEEKIRQGFFCILELEELGKNFIFPHENTMKEPKIDRLKLLKVCLCNFSQPFFLYFDKERILDNFLKEKISKKTPLFDFYDEKNIRHIVWRVDEGIDFMIKFMEDKFVIIADGHHRYETALEFKNLMKREGKFKDSFNFIAAYFANIYGEGLSILPTHRVIKVKEEVIENFLKNSKEYFDIKESKSSESILELYYQGKSYSITLKKPNISNLGVVILHKFILPKFFKENLNISFIKDKNEAIDLVNSKKFSCAFFLKPIKPEEMIEIVLKKEKLPQKSTYFYPKIPSGLIMRKL